AAGSPWRMILCHSETAAVEEYRCSRRHEVITRRANIMACMYSDMTGRVPGIANGIIVTDIGT
ncbi:hypothetical protein HAX54_031331, partial [Datura stramonium]|nr:hypothetical protein [Datura stramonium]